MTNQEPLRRRWICPDCGGTDYLEGPHRGLSVTFACASCWSGFNDVVSYYTRRGDPGGKIPENMRNSKIFHTPRRDFYPALVMEEGE